MLFHSHDSREEGVCLRYSMHLALVHFLTCILRVWRLCYSLRLECFFDLLLTVHHRHCNVSICHQANSPYMFRSLEFTRFNRYQSSRIHVLTCTCGLGAGYGQLKAREGLRHPSAGFVNNSPRYNLFQSFPHSKDIWFDCAVAFLKLLRCFHGDLAGCPFDVSNVEVFTGNDVLCTRQRNSREVRGY